MTSAPSAEPPPGRHHGRTACLSERATILWTTVVLALIAAAAWGFLARERQAVIDADLVQTRWFAQLVGARLGADLDGLESSLDSVAQALPQRYTAEIETLLRQVGASRPGLCCLAVVFADGTWISSAAPAGPRKTLASETVRSLPAASASALVPRMRHTDLATLFVPWKDPDAAWQGFGVGRGATDLHGRPVRLIAMLHPTAISQTLQAAWPSPAAGWSAQIETLDPSPGRKPLPAHASRLGRWGAQVVLERPPSDALAPWRSTRNTTLLLAAIAGLAAVAGAAGAVRQMRAGRRLNQALARYHRQHRLQHQATRQLLDGVPVILFRIDAEGVVSQTNRRWQDLTGWAAEAIEGHRLDTLVQDQDQARIEYALRQQDEKTLRIHTRLKRREGPGLPVDITLTRIEAAGIASGYFGTAHNVSDRERVLDRLQREQAFTQQVINALSNPVFVKDDQNVLVAVNRAWEDFFGMKARQALGLDLSGLPIAEDPAHQKTDTDLWHGLLDQTRYETRAQRSDGKTREIKVTKVMVHDDRGLRSKVVCELEDITEYVEARRSIEMARDAAVASEHVKTTFIANVSHELRTPLQSVLGFSELALRRQLPGDRLRAVLEDIHAAGQRMLNLVNDLLDVSRLDSAQTTLALADGDIRQVLTSVARELSPIAMQREVDLVVSMPDRPVPAAFHELRLGQVVRNVAANALRFSPPQARVELSVASDRNGHLITVRDHGPGIPEPELEAIFEPFTQSSRTADGSGGTGLGLTISRSIMKAHKGRIWAENARDGGSLFHVWLPSKGARSSVQFLETQPASPE